MKKEFRKPTLEVVEFSAEDVIQTSGCSSDCPDDVCTPKCYIEGQA